MKVYCVQMDLAWHNALENRRRAQEMIARATPEPGSLVVLPEMFASGYTADVAAATDSPGDENAAWCATQAAEYGCTMIAGLVSTGHDGRGRNQALVCGPGGEIGRYTKIHPFKMGGEGEQFAPGDRPHVFEIEAGSHGTVRVAPLICYDLRFPETFREAAAAGVDVFVVIASWPAKREHHWQALLRARAIENQAYVIGVNRTGSDPNLVYSGGSRVYDCDGQCRLAMDELPGVAATSLDLAGQRSVRAQLPFLQDLLAGRGEGGLAPLFEPAVSLSR